MDILEIINELEEVIEESTKIPLLGKILIDDDLIMEYVDRIRSAIPEEIRQAKLVNKEKDRILNLAQQEATNLINNAQLEISKMAGDSEVSKQAHLKAEEIYSKARKTAQEIHSGATQYADDILGKIETDMEKALIIVKKSREELKPKASNEAAAGQK